MFLTRALDVFMVVFRVIHLDADLQCRSGWKAQKEPWLGWGSETLLSRLAQWRAGDVKGLSHSYLWVCMLSYAILRVGQDGCDSSLVGTLEPRRLARVFPREPSLGGRSLITRDRHTQEGPGKHYL